MFEPTNSSKYDYLKLNRALDKVKSRVFLGNDSAFYGPLMSSMEFYWSEEVETAATDGVRIWWNPEFFLTGPAKFQSETFNEFVLRHELGHPARLHMLRQGDRCGRLWNYACDVRINNDLKRIGCNWGTFPAWFRPDLDLNGAMAEEDIFDALFNQGFQVPMSPWGNGDMDEDATDKTTARKAIDKVVRSVTNAKMEGQPGSIPGNVETMLDHFLAPIIPWEQHVRQWMGDLLDNAHTWARPNRRYTDMYLPSHFEEDGRLEHLVYFQDVSGSITNQEIIRFNSELKHVWEEFKPKKMTIVQFDTIIQKVDILRDGDEFATIEIKGRGGTCLRCVREFILEHKPTAAVIFSDMQVAPMEPLPVEIPVLWIASNAPACKVNFGKVVHIKV